MMQTLNLGAAVDDPIVLVTGASGFIGRQCLEPLVRAGCTVHAAGRRRPATATEGVRWHEVDLLHQGRARALVTDIRPTHLLHLAWYAEPGLFWTSSENYRHVAASLELMESFTAHGGRRALIAGTGAEYDWRSGVCREGVTPLAPESVYAVCKHALHCMASIMAREGGVSLAWGRLFWLYGPGEDRNRLVSGVITSLLAGREALTTAGEQRRPFLYVEDVAAAFAAVLLSRVQGAINIAAADAVPVRAIVEMIGRKLGASDRLRIGGVPDSNAQPPVVAADTTRLATEVGWTPSYDLDAGIARTIAWWRAHPGLWG